MYVSDLIRIAAAGGGLRLDCTKHYVSDIIKIACAASDSQAKLILENSNKLYVSDAIKIASAGHGSVIFNDLQ